ncbi:MAG: hypothetical protein K0Q72_2083 [Armatimonadetes bacterium]|jgi:hypothetical protein|nr:hypothetical protein [Armatimonadota bacterium]
MHRRPPHLTYFSPDAPERIARLRQAGHLFQNETEDASGQVNGGTLVAPDGQRIFVFAE